MSVTGRPGDNAGRMARALRVGTVSGLAHLGGSRLATRGHHVGVAKSVRNSDRIPTFAVLFGILGGLGVTVVIAIIAELIHPGSGLGLGRLWLLVAMIIWWPIWYALLHRRYSVQRVAAFEEHSKRQEIKYQRWLFAYVMPMIALVFLIVGFVDARPGWRAAHGWGVSGTFTVGSQDCHKGCMTYGDFTSTDGRDSRQAVQLVEGGSSPRRAVGATVAALDTADRLGVYPVGTKEWQSSLAIGLLGAGYLVGWLAWLMRRFGGRRETDLP
jgi:hypothetical protein